MQVPNQSQAETTTKPVRPVSESQPVLSYILSGVEGGVYEVASRAKLRGEEPTPLSTSEEDSAAPQEVSMARSTSPHNGSGVYSILQELTAEFVLDDESQPKWGDGRVIEEPSLPSPGSISGASRNPVPRRAELALDRTDRGKAGSSASEAQDFAAEIESLRIALQRLQLACPG